MDVQRLHVAGGWSLLAVTCRQIATRRGPVEVAGYNSLMLVRRGTFCVHRGARSIVADPLTLIEFRTGDEYRVSHPLGPGDDCIELACADEMMDELSRDIEHRASAAVAWHLGNLERRARRRLINDLELEEAAALLFALPTGRAVPRVRAASRRKVEFAKLMMLADPARPWTLGELARLVGCSPFHLTRLFRRTTGFALHKYLVHTRLALALNRVLDGCDDLAALACDLGFASHSHLAAAFREVYGVTPSAARAGIAGHSY